VLCLLGKYAQAIKHLKEYWALSQKLGDVTQQALAALNLGVTLMQKKGDERLGEAKHGLCLALDCNTFVKNGETVGRLTTIQLDATMNLSLVAFITGQEAEALTYLQAHMHQCVLGARSRCVGCWQVRGEDTLMLTCGGCKVARSLLHLHILSSIITQCITHSRKVM
jgi:hypothetical protein